MRRVLHRLGFLEGEDVVTLKGRIACEVSTADELLASELLFSNALKDLNAEEICAVLSCLVCHEKHDEPEPVHPKLLAGQTLIILLLIVLLLLLIVLLLLLLLLLLLIVLLLMLMLLDAGHVAAAAAAAGCGVAAADGFIFSVVCAGPLV